MEVKLWLYFKAATQIKLKLRYVVFRHIDDCYIWRRKVEAYKPQDTVPTVKYGGGSNMFWDDVLLESLLPFTK